MKDYRSWPNIHTHPSAEAISNLRRRFHRSDFGIHHRIMSTACNSPTINHFGHSHPLHLVDVVTHHTDRPNCCFVCRTKVSGWTYKCSRPSGVDCGGFSVHPNCVLLPRSIADPAHFNSLHTLTLFAVPTYTTQCFRCNGCGYVGYGLNYHCSVADCNFDLHVACATHKPPSIIQSPHPSPSWPPPPPPPQPQPQTAGYYGLGGGNYRPLPMRQQFGLGMLRVGLQGIAWSAGQHAGDLIWKNMSGGEDHSGGNDDAGGVGGGVFSDLLDSFISS